MRAGAGIQSAQTSRDWRKSAGSRAIAAPRHLGFYRRRASKIYNCDAATISDALDLYKSGKLKEAHDADVTGMKDTRIIYKPIGIIRSEHKLAEKTPIQPVYAKGCKGQAEIFDEFAEGLADSTAFPTFI